MLGAGASRSRMAQTLNAAYGEGLLSEHTLARRLELLFEGPLVDPWPLIGDLTLRVPRRNRTEVRERLAGWLAARVRRSECPPPAVLALDWTGGQEELIVGRHPDCDVVLEGGSVSRHHLRLTFRDGRWVLRDLGSTNGTLLNGAPVGRCQLRPGDLLELGERALLVD